MLGTKYHNMVVFYDVYTRDYEVRRRDEVMKIERMQQQLLDRVLLRAYHKGIWHKRTVAGWKR